MSIRNLELSRVIYHATKGSGKSRLLKLIAYLSYNGKLFLDLKEAVLFRTAKNHTIVLMNLKELATKIVRL